MERKSSISKRQSVRDNGKDACLDIGLLSPCAEAKDPLLWSHYADSHRGVALEFDASFTMEAPFGAAKPVKYCERVPRVYSRKQFIESALNLNPISGDQRTLLPLVMTKSLEWSYEKASIAPTRSGQALSRRTASDCARPTADAECLHQAPAPHRE
jgi:hypothetical protein